MSILITGSLFAIALLAFLLALWLAYLEQQATLASEQQSSIPHSTFSIDEQDATTPARQSEPELLPATRQQELPLVSSGQLYELLMQMRALQTEASEICSHLQALTLHVEQQLQQHQPAPLSLREEQAV